MAITDKEQITSPDIEAYQAMKLLESGDTQEAVKKCMDAISRWGANRNCYLVMARAHIEQEEYGFAEEALQSVLQLDPEHPAAWAMMGEVYFRLGKETKVEYCRQRLESIFPALTETEEPEDIENLSEEAIETPAVSEEAAFSIVPLENLDEDTGKLSVDDDSLTETEIVATAESEHHDDAGVEEKTGGLKSELFETATFADICINQGKYEKAYKIYKSLLNLEPDNAKYKEKIEFINRKWEENDSQ